jgi:tetratricopeptide (TPR) repeat protein
MIPLAGILYTAAFAAMAALRREGFSVAFVAQSLAATAVFSLLNLLAGPSGAQGAQLHPVAFLVALYLLTMRVRILLDLGSIAAGAGRVALAGRIYNLALALLPSPAETCIAAINRGVCRLQSGDVDGAVGLLSEALGAAGQKSVGVKFRSAGHYNLGIAYLRQGRKPQAEAELRRVIELWPVSEYARRAERSLRQIT